jgi:tRNA(Arg) A34 adenosine deaminase TadA
MDMNKFFRIALQKANEHDYGDLEYHLCAVIVRGGSVVSVGYNKRNTNAFVEHYTDMAKGQRDWCMSTHAEMDCVLQARAKIDLAGAKIYVVRKHVNVKKYGTFALAKPCEICQHVLYNYGIRRAIYTIDDNNHGTMKIVNPALEWKEDSK